jgi:hypothetical protein
MSSKQVCRANHYVPQEYLRRWANAEGKVWTYRILVSNESVPAWKLSSRRGVAYYNHLYTRMVATGESDEIEDWLNSEFETPAHEAIQKAVGDGKMSANDWRCLIRFLAAQDVRTPARLIEGIKRWEKTLPEDVEQTLSEMAKL